MKIFVPDYFKNFRCIADRCPDTCCAGWEVYLDPDSTQYYKTVGGEIGEKLRSRLAKDEDGDDCFTLDENNRCPFLNGSNLCELYIALGEKSLCSTCTLFPRFYDDFDSFREEGLGFGCPEAARIILENNRPLVLTEYGETEGNDFDIDKEFLKHLLTLRERIFKIINDNSISFKLKITKIFSLCESMQEAIDGETTDRKTHSDFRQCVETLSQMEYIDEKRKNFFLSLNDNNFNSEVYQTYQNDFNRLLEYYIFRYFLKAVYDYDVLTKVKYGVFACAVTGRLYAKGIDRITAMYGYSKEIEYSDVNLEILDNALYENFSVNDLIELF